LGDSQRKLVESQNLSELQINDLVMQLNIRDAEAVEQRNREKLTIDKKDEEIRRLTSNL
jgi:hypothetical protein